MNQQSKFSNKEHFPTLTSLRGVASLWVAIGHLSWSVPSIVLLSLFPFVQQGYLAVDFFFILSGFVLAHAYKIDTINSLENFLKFCRARIARIFPIHIFLLLVFSCVYFLLLKNSITLPGFYSLKSLFAEFFLLHILPFFNDKYFYAWNYPSWTLVLEVWYFIIISGVIAIVSTINRRYFIKKYIGLKWKNIFLVILSGLVLTLACIPIISNSPSFIDSPNFFNSIIRSGIEFLTGYFLYKIFTIERFNLTKTETYFIFALILIGIFGWPFIPRIFIISFWIILIPFIIVVSLDAKNILYKVLSRPAMLYLGNISYSLYIVHGPTERIFAYVYQGLEPTKLIVFITYLLYIGCILMFAHFINKYIEVPFMMYFKNNKLLLVKK